MGKDLSPGKAGEILHHGEVHGHPLTEAQRRFMGWVAGGRKRPKRRRLERKGVVVSKGFTERLAEVAKRRYTAGQEVAMQKHYGPGDHPSGSPQAVHGGRGGSARFGGRGLSADERKRLEEELGALEYKQVMTAGSPPKDYYDSEEGGPSATTRIRYLDGQIRNNIPGFWRVFEGHRYTHKAKCAQCGKTIEATGLAIGSHRRKHYREVRRAMSLEDLAREQDRLDQEDRERRYRSYLEES